MRTYVLVLAAIFALGCDDKPKASPAPKPSASSAPLPSAVVAPPVASAPVPEQIICQNILVSYVGAQKAPRKLSRTKDEARKRVELVASLAKDSPDDFDELVKKWSDDPSAERLGSTGLIKRGDVVKPFADAAWGLQIGQVTGVVETPFGFHVIKRTQ
jgi:hypothetical protein